jgi:hypothetical protein
MPYRALLSVLVAVAIFLAPMTTAWAVVVQGMNSAKSEAVRHAEGGADSQGAAGMEDCAAMMQAAGGPSDCPCCDPEKACPPQLCVYKCSQFLAVAPQPQPTGQLIAVLLRPRTSAHPPDWSDQPQPPPPRT